MAVRLNKYLADRGVGARRKCDDLIAQGRVSVNGRVVSEAGSKVEEDRDRVSVDGRPVGGKAQHVYYVLNKPVGVITTLDDEHGRRSVAEFLPRGARVYPVGRLDADTSGLLLLTNDGELAHKLMHPRYGVQKVYRVRLAAEPRADQLRRLAQGVRFDKNLVSGPARVRRIDPGFDAIMIELIIHEGRFRQVRRMCEAVGLEVTGLHRVGYGPIRLGPLARGMFRELSEEEVGHLRAAGSRPGGGRFDHLRPARAAKPAAVSAPKHEPEDEDSEEQDDQEEQETHEETFIPGGGRLEPLEDSFPESDDEPVWPARAGRKGDADWQAEHAPSAGPANRKRDSPGERPDRERGPGRRGEARPARGTGRTERPTAARSSREGARSSREPASRPDRDRMPTTPGRGAGGRFERSGPPRAERGRAAAKSPRASGRIERTDAPRARFGGEAPRASSGGRIERRPAPRGAGGRDGPRPTSRDVRFERRPARRASEGRGGPRPDRGGGRSTTRPGTRGKPVRRREGSGGHPFEQFERPPVGRAAAGRSSSRSARSGGRFERPAGGRGSAPRSRTGRAGPRDSRGAGRAERRPAGRMGERTPDRGSPGPGRPARGRAAPSSGRRAPRPAPSGRSGGRNPSRGRRGRA
jgi:23S rRNA pseudouridine2605 synthase